MHSDSEAAELACDDFAVRYEGAEAGFVLLRSLHGSGQRIDDHNQGQLAERTVFALYLNGLQDRVCVCVV